MTERWKTPSVPIKRYGRETLGKENAEPNFAKAVIHFLDSAYWIENNIGDPDKHRTQALRRASRLVSGERLEAAQNTAESLYAQYKELAGVQPDEPLTYSAIAALERARKGPESQITSEYTPAVRVVTPRDIAERAFDVKKGAAEKKFRDGYRQLMSSTDHRLKIVNSNDRVHLEEDLVFSNSEEDIQKRIRQRRLSGKRYLEEEARVKSEQELMTSEEESDPYEKVMAILELAKNPSKQNVTKLVRELENGDAMIREAAADVLIQAGWRPRTQEELVPYYVAKEDWGRVLDVGDTAIPSLIKGLTRIKELPVRQMITDVLDELGYDPATANLRQRVFYYSVKDDFYHLSMLGPSAIPYVREVITKGVLAYPTGTNLLQELDSIAAERVLRRLTWDKDEDLQIFAKKALGYKARIDPISLQMLVIDPRPDRLYQALVAVRPEWREFVIPPRDEFISLAEALLYLPPVGGKVEAPTDNKYFRGALSPSMTIEEQVNQLATLRQKGSLPQFPEGYIHQLTVQGRLPDPFKYAALSIILHSPYRNDWSKPFFEAEWGQIAPMIHDGGNVDPGVSPIWRHKGRTDFLQRIVPVFQPNLEQLEQLSPEERGQYSIEELAKARYEQEERERLLIEAKAYQRLALALHSKVGTAPIPGEAASRLASHWDSFVKRMDMVLEEYDIAGAAKVKWFTDKPVPEHSLGGYGDRFEAPWRPIQKELVHLEQTRMSHPELKDRIRQILQDSTDSIDEEIGLISR